MIETGNALAKPIISKVSRTLIKASKGKKAIPDWDAIEELHEEVEKFLQEIDPELADDHNLHWGTSHGSDEINLAAGKRSFRASMQYFAG